MKLFFVAFVGTHVPLLTIIISILFRQGGFISHLPDVLLLIAATILGTALTLVGIWLVLAPVENATRAVNRYRTDRRIEIEPTQFCDTAGRLLNGVRSLLLEVEDLLRERERQACSDPLTGLLNRRGFEAKVAAESADGEAACLALFDLDHFKRVNDQFGHAKGDDVLRAFATVLSRCVRDTDFVGRVGGEEFAVLFPRTDEETARDLCDRIRETTAQEVRLPCAVTTSVGIARAWRGETVDALAARADAALYYAKNNGRNRVVVLKAAA